MVHVPQMRDLVRDGGAADMVGRHRQPPTVAQIAGRGATAPAAAWVADPDAPDGQPRRGGKRPALALYQIERLRLQPALDPATNRLGRPAEQPRIVRKSVV